MKKLTTDIFTELKTYPNQAVIWEIIEQGKTGEIFDLPGGAILLLEYCSDDPFAFIAGHLTDEGVKEAIYILSKCRFPMLYCQPKYHSLFLKRDWNLHLRVEFILNLQKHLQRQFTTNNQVKLIETIELFKNCLWYKEKSELYTSVENFLQYGLGYALCKDGQVLSEAYATIGGGYAELSVVTSPDFRKKGYAAQVLAALIKRCEELKVIPVWSCNIGNIASFNTALKIGFEPSFYYVSMVPSASNVLWQ